MMIKYYKILFLFFIITSVQAQSDCFNSDFSNGDFSGWRPYYGTRNNPSFKTGENPGRHLIMNAGDFDPYAAECNAQLPTVPPGEIHSARLGNAYGGSEAEKLIYDINVTEDNNLFIYKYAVVLQDGGHEQDAQPSFSVRILNDQGKIIDPDCGIYNVSSAEPNQNAHTCSEIYWTQWNSVGLNLTNYVGKKISIEFTTKDCEFQLHFGYAYISAKCSKLKANVAVCSGGNNFTLTAPLGFIGYSWSYKGQIVGTPSQSISLPLADYPAGATFECLLTSYNNSNKCESVIEVQLSNPIVITPDFSIALPCKTDYNTFSPIFFSDKTTIINGVVNKLEWDFGDGKTSEETNPVHLYQNSGDYNVSLTAYSDNGCSILTSKSIHIENNPYSKPVIDETQTFCSYPLPTIASINSNGQTLKWFATLLSANELDTNIEFYNNIDVYCSVLKDGCLGPRIKVSILITPTDPPTGNKTQYFCLNEAPTVADLEIKEPSPLWYANQDGGNPLSASTSLKNNTTYYASVTNATSGCETPRLGITVILSDSSAVLAPDFTQEFCLNKELTLQDLKFYSPDIKYYNSMNATTPLSHSTLLENATTYYAAIMDPDILTCESNKRTAITVKISPCDITIYNLITIDDNTKNDHLEIGNIEYFPDNAVQVYNRFGQLVYKMSNYGVNSNFFYGKANAGEVFMKDEKLPTGSYFYIINYKKADQADGTKKGFLYIHNNG